MKITVNMDEVIKNLDMTSKKHREVLLQAMYREAEIISTNSQRRTPVDTGALRASHRVEAVDDGVTVTVGGPAQSYAIYVHEDLQAYHRVGEAKFLERSFQDRMPIDKRLAAEVKRGVS